MESGFPMDMGSIIIRGRTGSCRTQYFWDASNGFVDEAQPDGSISRTILKSPEQARKQAWVSSAVAIAMGLAAEASL
jgi:hypothetical protein